MEYIKDSEFIRGNCPMTKEEVRIISLAKMELRDDSRVIDVGAGTGSISIACALSCRNGEVISVERNEDAVEVIKQNVEKFNVQNLKLIEDEAMNAVSSIEGEFDSIFIGGSGGNLEDIIETYGEKLKDNGTMVLNFITLTNVHTAMEKLKELNYNVDCTMVSISKTKGKTHMLIANNPIFVVTAKK